MHQNKHEIIRLLDGLLCDIEEQAYNIDADFDDIVESISNRDDQLSLAIIQTQVA